MSLPSDLDLWRSAGIMVREWGSRAPAAARDRAKRLDASGDKDGGDPAADCEAVRSAVERRGHEAVDTCAYVF